MLHEFQRPPTIIRGKRPEVHFTAKWIRVSKGALQGRGDSPDVALLQGSAVISAVA